MENGTWKMENYPFLDSTRFILEVIDKKPAKKW